MAGISKRQVSYIRKSLESRQCESTAPALHLLSQLTDCPKMTVRVLKYPMPTSFSHWKGLLEAHDFKQGECFTWLWLLGRFAELGVGWAQEITEIYLEAKELFLVPENIRHLKKLEMLDLTNNWLSRLPKTLVELKSLKTLHLSENDFVYCPDWFEDLSIEMIYIYDNPLEQISRGMKALYIHESMWLRLAEQIIQLQGLESLEISCIPYLINYDWLAQQRNLKRVTFSYCEMWKLPDSLFVHQELESLTLTGLEIGPLPSRLGELRGLKELHVDSCDIGSLPKSLAQCTQLRKVVLDYNRFKRVPSVLKHAKLLEVLDLSSNLIRTLPKWVGSLENIHTLNLNANNLTVVPDVIQQLGNLVELNLSGNELTELPGWLFEQTSLRRLFISLNEIPLEQVFALQCALPNCQIFF